MEDTSEYEPDSGIMYLTGMIAVQSNLGARDTCMITSQSASFTATIEDGAEFQFHRHWSDSDMGIASCSRRSLLCGYF